MRSASGQQCKVKMRGSEKNVNENTYECVSSKKDVTGSFTFSVVQNDLLLFFHPSRFPSPLGITRFYILFQQTLIIIESFAFSPG